MSDPGLDTPLAQAGGHDLDSPGVPEVSPIARLHSVLRGRYLVALGLGALLGAAGAAAGFTLPAVTYTSRGTIEVSPIVPRILFRTDENAPLQMYDAYVAMQASLLRSRRVLDRAFDSDAWRALGGVGTDADRTAFMRSVSIESPPRSQYIEVTFTHTSPVAAMTAVEQVIKSYLAIVEEREGRNDMSTLSVLENQRTITANKLAEVRSEILTRSGDLGSEAIEARYQFVVAQVNELDRLLGEIDVDLSAGGTAGGDGAREPTPQEIAVTDPRMDTLLFERTQLEARIKSLQEWAGSGRKELVDAQSELLATNHHIEERRAAVVAAQGALPEGGVLTRHGKEQHRERISKMRDAREEEVRRLGKVRSELANLSTEKSLLEERLEEVKRRIDQINIESAAVHGRIGVISLGDLPLEPDNDKRRVLAAGGGMAGMSLGIGLVALYGLLGARMRHLDDVDARARRGRFLGILPQMTLSAGAEAVAMADFCVHHVRAMLQLRRSDARRIVGVTSASAGAGKSTVAMALGVSFSGTGARTLLVDCDLVGHGLSSLQRSLVAASLRRPAPAPGGEGHAARFPNVLEIVSAGAVSATRAELAGLVAEARGRVADADDRAAPWLRAAEHLLAQEGSGDGERRASPGVLDAMDGRPLEECVRESGVPGLSILPTGSARERDVARFSMESMTRLLAECATRYDIVIVDAGPVVGSIEASFALARADDVLFVVPKGESQGLVGEAFERLDAIRANVSGIVFNRASVEDVQRSSYSTRSARSADPVHAS